MRITNEYLESTLSIINNSIKGRGFSGAYGVQHCYGHTNVVFYPDRDSSGCSDVRCGLTKSEAYDVLQGIYHALNCAMR